MKTTTSAQKTVRSKTQTSGPTRSVHFEFKSTEAKAVCIAGSFNNWRPQASDMMKLADGRWVKELTLNPGQYEYRFVVDGVWMTDPVCPDTVPNPFGERNSVLTVGEIRNVNRPR